MFSLSIKDNFKSNLNSLLYEIEEKASQQVPRKESGYHYDDLSYSLLWKPLFDTITPEEKKSDLLRFKPLVESYFGTRTFTIDKSAWDRVMIMCYLESDAKLIIHMGKLCQSTCHVIDIKVVTKQRMTVEESNICFRNLGIVNSEFLPQLPRIKDALALFIK